MTCEGHRLKTQTTFRQNPLDMAMAAIVLAFAALVSLFAIRNNDVWWMMAVGRRILETKAFIYKDPFSFTLAGAPWSPQAYLSAIVFYLVHQGAGAAGLIVLRAVLVVATFAVVLRTLARTGVSWAMAAPVVVLVVLVSQTRFIVRAHLFEYLFLSILMGFLLTSHERKGRSFFVVPAVVQVLWTNMHPSFLLGPALVGLFFAGEWLSERITPRLSGIRPLHRRRQAGDYRRAALLFAVVVAACFVNPNPGAFLSQPFGGAQRELVSRFTLEWKSPFDPAIAGAGFHPYYEILLALAAVAVFMNLKRLSLGALFLLLGTMYLSLQSHRFRVEFGLVALPLVCVMLRDAPPLAAARKAIGGAPSRWLPRAALSAVAVLLVVFTARGRVEVDGTVKARYPDRALGFVIGNDVAHRPFSTIGFGSYMAWDLYGERQTFIDGRNYDAGLYRDFLGAQQNAQALGHVIAKYRLDAFILPSIEDSDAGMTRIHEALAAMPSWDLVYMDPVAYVYVDDASADSAFVAAHAYRAYHPLTLASTPPALRGAVVAELERAAAEAPEYPRVWLDLGAAANATGSHDRAIEALETATRLEPDNAVAWNRLGIAEQTAGRRDEAVEAFQRLVEVAPDVAQSHLRLAEVLRWAGRNPEAALSYERAIEIEPGNAEPYVGLYEMYAAGHFWDAALSAAEKLQAAVPKSYLGYYYAAEALHELGRDPEAIAMGVQAIGVNPKAAVAHLFLAQRYDERGEYSKALERVESTLVLDPRNATALDMRGQLQRKLGR